jgi:lysophospholipase L1-like esterase
MKVLRYSLYLLTAAWVMGEVLARLFIPVHSESPTPSRSEAHPYIRSDWIPGYQATRVVEGIGSENKTFALKINAFGFRSESMTTADKPDNTYRIFFLGGSTTESISLPGEKTFPHLVEKMLSVSFPKKRFECINGGVSGYMAADVLAMLLYKVLYYEPDLIVVMTAVNDLRYGTVPTYDPIRRPDLERKLYRPGIRYLLSSLSEKILRKSHLFVVLKRRWLNRIQPQDQIRQLALKRSRMVKSTISTSKAFKDYLKSLEEIIFIAKGHGIRLLFLTEPFLYQENASPEVEEKLWMGLMRKNVNLSTNFLNHEMHRFHDGMRQLSQKHHVELLDLANEIPKDLTHFYDDVHFTAAGSAKAAQVLTRYLSETAALLGTPT